MHTSPKLPSFVILVFAQGDVALASSDSLDVSAQSMHDSPQGGRLLKSFVLPELASAELSAESDGAVVITALTQGEEGTVCIKISAFGVAGELVSYSSGVAELSDVSAKVSSYLKMARSRFVDLLPFRTSSISPLTYREPSAYSVSFRIIPI